LANRLRLTKVRAAVLAVVLDVDGVASVVLDEALRYE